MLHAPARHSTVPEFLPPAGVWVTGLTTYLNYDAIGGFGGIKLTYSDGSFWSLGDVTGNGGMVQSTQSVE